MIDIDSANPRMRVARQQEATFKHAREEQVGSVSRLTGDLLEAVGSNVFSVAQIHQLTGAVAAGGSTLGTEITVSSEHTLQLIGSSGPRRSNEWNCGPSN
jgi:hypothetical protein